ncbi:hypothetical protein [Micromonospora sp. SH-82]|uniref:hypothetical protein n=1 Tax=Micromonospora sp. SH-82 TaxID=3132938 RepID=UPI003EBD129C
MTAGTTVHSPDGTPVVLGEIGQRVLLANSRVRVWEVDLAPGETQPWHLHHNPYVVLCVQSSDCRMDWLDGSPPRFITEQVGNAIYRPVSPVHMLTNHGDRRYRNRLIEVLDLGEEASGEALEQWSGTPTVPATAVTVLDLDEVTVRRLTAEPGVEHTWQAGTVPAVVVPLEGGPGVDSTPDGGVRYLNPGETYAVRNPGETPYEVQIVELRHLRSR